MKVKDMTYIALMAAILCVVAPIIIPLPFSPIPLSLATFIIYLLSVVIGAKKAVIAVIIYIIIGAVGVPVFSGYGAGLQKIVGPTGGYMLGYIACALASGYFADKFESKIYMYAIGMVLGTAICYTLGTLWMSYSTGMKFVEALFAGVIPFLIGDVIKIVVATIVGYKIRRIIIKTNPRG